MNRRTLAGDRRRRKMITAGWAIGVALVVILLIYFERTEILYILSTVSVAAILLIVAFSDLAHTDATEHDAVQARNAAVVANRER